MKVKQHTIQKQVELSGVGLHTGVVSNMTFLPAAPNHGIKFQRIDLEGRPTVDADCDLVVDVSRGTTLEQNGARVYTVEHVLAALVSRSEERRVGKESASMCRSRWSPYH